MGYRRAVASQTLAGEMDLNPEHLPGSDIDNTVGERLEAGDRL